MASKLASPAVPVKVLNAILTEEGVTVKGSKSEKAAYLAKTVPAHRLQDMLEEHAGVKVPKGKTRAAPQEEVHDGFAELPGNSDTEEPKKGGRSSKKTKGEEVAKPNAKAKAKGKAKGKAKAVPPPALHKCTQCPKMYVNKAGENMCDECVEKDQEPAKVAEEPVQAAEEPAEEAKPAEEAEAAGLHSGAGGGSAKGEDVLF